MPQIYSERIPHDMGDVPDFVRYMALALGLGLARSFSGYLETSKFSFRAAGAELFIALVCGYGAWEVGKIFIPGKEVVLVIFASWAGIKGLDWFVLKMQKKFEKILGSEAGEEK